MRTKLFNAIKVSALAALLSFGLSFVYAWTAPTQNPPAGNVSAPINTSGTAQTKTGNLTISATTTSSYFADLANPLFFLQPSGDSRFWNTTIAGTTTTNGLKVLNGAGANKVLTSDASGNASWATPSGGGGATGGILSTAMTKQYSTTVTTNWVAPAGVTGITVMIVAGGGSGGGAYCYNNAAACNGTDGWDTSAFGHTVYGGKHGGGGGYYGTNGAGGLGGSGGTGDVINSNGANGTAGGGPGGAAPCGSIMAPLIGGCSGGTGTVGAQGVVGGNGQPAGGGGGGGAYLSASGGGGGGGGVTFFKTTVTPGASYTLTVGAGGAHRTVASNTPWGYPITIGGDGGAGIVFINY